MSSNEARAWWADVEHLREQIEGQSSAPAALRTPVATATPPRERRTVRITGHGAGTITPRALVETGNRRSGARSPAQRAARRPDHIALWAVFLGFALVLIALTSAGG